ncbi:tumor necrosis factor ligand superfamily member 12 isoform X4 [Manis javanica]|uniref:tumor necrosis factor ligand superfamily member 12 isoform X4 n=1 Tax=Manis javanica TaxID=9974 RepID=UPI00187A29A8|nr:uncharacterized protein LOC108404277 isoform X4 [Manis javanica]
MGSAASPPAHWTGWSFCSFLLSLPFPGPPHGEYRLHTPSRQAAHSHKHRSHFYMLSCSVPVHPGSLGAPKWARRAPRSVHSAVPAPSLITQCPASCPHPPLPLRFPCPSLSPGRSARPLPLPRSLGSRDGGAVRQAQPPAPMAARRSQRRRGRRGEPGTALLAPLVLGLGLALACLGLLLAVVSLGSGASLSAQQEPSQGELVAEEDQDLLELNPQTEESQDPVVPFLKRLVRARRNAPKGRKTRARRVIAAHYEVHPRPGQDGAQAGAL